MKNKEKIDEKEILESAEKAKKAGLDEEIGIAARLVDLGKIGSPPGDLVIYCANMICTNSYLISGKDNGSAWYGCSTCDDTHWFCKKVTCKKMLQNHVNTTKARRIVNV